MKDSGPIFETEKQLADSFAIRQVRSLLSRTTCADCHFSKNDVTITETAESLGITSYIVVPSTVCKDSLKDCSPDI